MKEQVTMSAGNSQPIVEETKELVPASTVVDAAAEKNEHHVTDQFLQDFAYKPTKIVQGKNSKFGFGFFITPSTSYRRLIDDKAKDNIRCCTNLRTACYKLYYGCKQHCEA